MIDIFRKELQLHREIFKGDTLIVLADPVSYLGTRLDDLHHGRGNPQNCYKFDARHCGSRATRASLELVSRVIQ